MPSTPQHKQTLALGKLIGPAIKLQSSNGTVNIVGGKLLKKSFEIG
jgi:hypothetical protein